MRFEKGETSCASYGAELSLRDLESGNSCLAQAPGPARPLSQDANPRRMINSTPAPALNTFIMTCRYPWPANYQLMIINNSQVT